MIIPENKTVVLEDGSEYFILKTLKHKGVNYAVALNLSDAAFVLMQVKTDTVVLVENETLVAEIMDNLMLDAAFVESFNKNIDNILKQKK